MYDEIDLPVDLDRLQQHVHEVLIPNFEQANLNGMFGGWSILGHTTNPQDGFERGYQKYDSSIKNPEYAPPPWEYRKPTLACTGYMLELMQQIEEAGLYPCRARLTKIPPGGATSWHRDALDNQYSVRLHIPIETNPYCWFITETECHHFEVGKSYLVNVNEMHKAVNQGGTDRYHLIAQVWDTKGLSQKFDVAISHLMMQDMGMIIAKHRWIWGPK